MDITIAFEAIVLGSSPGGGTRKQPINHAMIRVEADMV